MLHNLLPHHHFVAVKTENAVHLAIEVSDKQLYVHKHGFDKAESVVKAAKKVNRQASFDTANWKRFNAAQIEKANIIRGKDAILALDAKPVNKELAFVPDTNGFIDGNVECSRCAGTGQFITKIVNGTPTGPAGEICFRCEGKGYHTAADRRRNYGHQVNYVPKGA